VYEKREKKHYWGRGKKVKGGEPREDPVILWERKRLVGGSFGKIQMG